MKKHSIEGALKLEETLRGMPAEDNSQAVQALRRSTAEALRTVLVEDTPSALKRDVDDLLWKTVFYKRIEFLRKSKSVDLAVKEDLQFVLRETLAFYNSLLKELEIQSGNKIACSKCLVCLGDAARYNGNVDKSSMYYRRALRKWPHGGQPHNQLSVLAFTQRDLLGQFARYQRAILVELPFPIAMNNFKLLLSRLPEGAVTRAQCVIDLDKTPQNVPLDICALIAYLAHDTSKDLHTITILESKIRDGLLKSFSSNDFQKISPSESKRGSAMVLLNVVILAIGTIENRFCKIEFSWDDKRMVIMRAVLEALATGISRQTKQLHTSFLLPAILVCLEWYEARKDTEYVSDLHTEAQELAQMIMLYARNNSISMDTSSPLSIGSPLVNNGSGGLAMTVTKFLWRDVSDCLPEDVELLGFSPLKGGHSKIDFTEAMSEIAGEYRLTSNILGLVDIQEKRLARTIAIAQRLTERDLDASKQEKNSQINGTLEENGDDCDLADEAIRIGTRGFESCSENENSAANLAFKDSTGNGIFDEGEEADDLGNDEEEEILFKPQMAAGVNRLKSSSISSTRSSEIPTSLLPPSMVPPLASHLHAPPQRFPVAAPGYSTFQPGPSDSVPNFSLFSFEPASMKPRRSPPPGFEPTGNGWSSYYGSPFPG